MKHKVMLILGGVVSGIVAFAVIYAWAATTAPGPYYATPSWDQKLQCDTQATCPRFIVLSNWNSQAVLDRETGLVWQRSPFDFGDVWGNWKTSCFQVRTGGRMGWRLPSVHELASLVEITNLAIQLPPGHPFQFAGNTFIFWSATTSPDFPTAAYYVDFQHGQVFDEYKSLPRRGWCVRGDMNAD